MAGKYTTIFFVHQVETFCLVKLCLDSNTSINNCFINTLNTELADANGAKHIGQ